MGMEVVGFIAFQAKSRDSPTIAIVDTHAFYYKKKDNNLVRIVI